MCLSTVLSFLSTCMTGNEPKTSWQIRYNVKRNTLVKPVLEILLVMTTGCTNVYRTNPQQTTHLCWSREWKGTEQLLLNHCACCVVIINASLDASLKQLHYQTEQVETRKKWGQRGNITSVLWITIQNDPSNYFLPLENQKILISAIWRILCLLWMV